MERLIERIEEIFAISVEEEYIDTGDAIELLEDILEYLKGIRDGSNR